VYVPRARPAAFTDTDTEAGAVPAAGVAASHDASSDVVKLSVPPPVLATASDCAGGAAPPSTAVNARLAGVTESAGGCGGATVRVTGTCFGEPLTPADVTVTVAVYVPAASPATLTEAVRSAGAEPLPGVTDSHDASSLAVNDRVPPPVLLTDSVLVAGLDPPAVALNASDDGVTASAGGGGGPGGTPMTYADSGPSLHTGPVAHVAGSAARLLLALPCSGR
jgi:hypothetical protein